MPTALTFTSLMSDLAVYLERAEDATDDAIGYNQLPRFINLAERRLAQKMKLQGQIQAVTATLAASAPTLVKPDRWLTTVSMNYGGGSSFNVRGAIFPRVYEYLRAVYPDDTVLGAPRFYADYDRTHWIFGPTPDQAYPIEILYYEQPAFLDSSNQTNWATEIIPNALLYASLWEASIGLKDKDWMPVYQAQYEDAIASISAEEMQKIVDRTSTRQGA